MKKFFTVKNLCLSGIIAALYAGLTVLLQALSFGPVQIRVAEAMTLLPILTPAAIPGLTIGCFVANLISSPYVMDWAVGTMATLIAAALSWRLRKNVYLAALMPVLSNGLMVGVMLYFVAGGSMIFNILTVAGGELVACFALGLPLIRALEKSPKLFQ